MSITEIDFNENTYQLLTVQNGRNVQYTLTLDGNVVHSDIAEDMSEDQVTKEFATNWIQTIDLPVMHKYNSRDRLYEYIEFLEELENEKRYGL